MKYLNIWPILFLTYSLSAEAMQCEDLMSSAGSIVNYSGQALKLSQDFLGGRKILNPKWSLDANPKVKGSWDGFRSQQHRSNGSSYWDFYVSTLDSQNVKDKSVETEPFEMAMADTEITTYYIRLKETQEVIAVLEHGFGFNVKIIHKYLKGTKEESFTYGYTLHGAMSSFFHSIGRYSFHRLSDGQNTPLFRGHFVPLGKEKVYDRIATKMKELKIKELRLTGYVDRKGHYETYKHSGYFFIENHDGLGVDLIDYRVYDQNNFDLTDINNLMSQNLESISVVEARNEKDKLVGVGSGMSLVEFLK